MGVGDWIVDAIVDALLVLAGVVVVVLLSVAAARRSDPHGDTPVVGLVLVIVLIGLMAVAGLAVAPLVGPPR